MLFRKKPKKFKIKIKPKKVRRIFRTKRPLLHIFRKKKIETRKEQSSFVNKETSSKFPVSQKSRSDFSGSQKPGVSVKPVIVIKPSAPKPIPLKPAITARPLKQKKPLFSFLRKKKLETRKEQSSFVNKETSSKFPVSQKSRSDFSGSQKPGVSVKPAVQITPVKPVEIKKPEMPKIVPESSEKIIKGSYMKRNVNFSLFFLIIIILSSLVALTSYYQSSYNKQLSSLQQRTEEFSTALQELRVKKILLNQTSYQLELESKSKEQLGDLYTGIKQEKEALQADLQKKKDELLAEQTKSAQLEQERASLRSELEDVKERMAIAEEEINELQDSIDSLRAQKDDCESKLSACCPNP